MTNVKLFADGADLEHILRLAADERIRGFTTNPTLMWKAGLTDYTVFCRRLLAEITDRPISFEVFADDAAEIRRQARMIAAWGENVYVKVPVTTTRGESLADVVRDLSADGVQVNVTALFTPAQVREITAAVADGRPELPVGLRRADRRHRPRPDPDHARGAGDHARGARARS